MHFNTRTQLQLQYNTFADCNLNLSLHRTHTHNHQLCAAHKLAALTGGSGGAFVLLFCRAVNSVGENITSKHCDLRRNQSKPAKSTCSYLSSQTAIQTSTAQ